MYTLLGDANLDGAVNGSDFAILATNFNKAVSGWDAGDFNYDGATTAPTSPRWRPISTRARARRRLDSFAAANGFLPMCRNRLPRGYCSLTGLECSAGESEKIDSIGEHCSAADERQGLHPAPSTLASRDACSAALMLLTAPGGTDNLSALYVGGDPVKSVGHSCKTSPRLPCCPYYRRQGAGQRRHRN